MADGARVVSVFGPFNSRVLVEMPVDAARLMFDGPLADNARTDVIDAALREVEAIRVRDSALAGGRPGCSTSSGLSACHSSV